MYHMSHVMCNVSHIIFTCQMSCVPFFYFYKVVKLKSAWSVINPRRVYYALCCNHITAADGKDLFVITLIFFLVFCQIMCLNSYEMTARSLYSSIDLFGHSPGFWQLFLFICCLKAGFAPFLSWVISKLFQEPKWIYKVHMTVLFMVYLFELMKPIID